MESICPVLRDDVDRGSGVFPELRVLVGGLYSKFLNRVDRRIKNDTPNRALFVIDPVYSVIVASRPLPISLGAWPARSGPEKRVAVRVLCDPSTGTCRGYSRGETH